MVDYPKLIVVYGYRGNECISKEFFCWDEKDFELQVNNWQKYERIDEWSRSVFN